ncbi:MAG: ribonuclease HI [Clostridiales Family XIII bacterium]|jgi:ribonuclease HI|nr:ribonuclease HI [Clostridiales Family XIII bacterium]
MDNILRIYTDGGCRGNERGKANVGGYGAVLTYKDHKKELSGGARDTTNNRMEMCALIAALEAVNKPAQTIEVHSDSAYLIDCLAKKWYVSWKKKGWITSAKKPVENQDLWERILELIDGHHMSYVKIKGHVDLGKPSTNVDALYKKFIERNGSGLSKDEFLVSLKMNSRVDELANLVLETLTTRTQ